MSTHEDGRERRVHDLKCWPQFFAALLRCDKTYELRKNDRDYRVGDTLHLREYAPGTSGGGAYTGRTLDVEVTYITDTGPWLADGYICMGLRAGEPDAWRVTGRQGLMPEDVLTDDAEAIARFRQRDWCTVIPLYRDTAPTESERR